MGKQKTMKAFIDTKSNSSVQVKVPDRVKQYTHCHVLVEFWNFKNKLILKVLPTQRKELSETSDFSSARLQSGKEEVILVIAKLARLGETNDMYKHVKIEFTNGLATQTSQFKK